MRGSYFVISSNERVFVIAVMRGSYFVIAVMRGSYFVIAVMRGSLL